MAAADSGKSALTASATSSKSDEWRTPVDLVRTLGREFRFVLDLAATQENKVAPAYFGLDHPIGVYRDALAVPGGWSGVAERVSRSLGVEVEAGAVSRPPAAFLNPPFSLLDKFLKLAGEAKAAGLTTVAVLPARIEKRSWHEDLAVNASEIRTLRARLKYWRTAEPGEVVGRGEKARVAKGGELLEDSALFASAVVIWRGGEPSMLGSPRSTFWDWRRDIPAQGTA